MLRLVMDEEPEQVTEQQQAQANATLARQQFYRRLVLLMSIAGR
ncbi:hypothetical protein [Marinobacterium arenosum]|nr:hypothetical protein [Marinobacterium arenosum]